MTKNTEWPNIASWEFCLGMGAGITLTSLILKLTKLQATKTDLGTMGSTDRTTRALLSKEMAMQMRRKYFCKAQSVSYENSSPLMIVKGNGQSLIDEQGIEYLDSRNNVGHVGWQNEKVMQAVQHQVSLTNSNTRYVHPKTVLLGEKLVEKFPSKLSKVFFVNSGSEANDLALRLAQTNSRAKGRKATKGHTIVVERAYHGHTCAVIDISPYKFLGKGGTGKPDHVHILPCPDIYREKGESETIDEFVERFLSKARVVCDEIESTDGHYVSSFFIESGMSVAGVILPPKGYLEGLYALIRERGGVCVADEVQVGFGRFGSHFWGFEQQEVIPDIVTMGKPFGNGFPLAAVVCTSEIAENFANGMEYFNTFGGNPVACAAGLAVLEEIERNKLQEKALSTGEFFMVKLKGLMDEAHGELIGDVRGAGLFLGIEFVRDRATKEPATEEVSVIATKLLQEHHILTSCDGKYYNVLVIKPPMTFGKDDVTRFVGALSKVLESIVGIDFSGIDLTPT